MEFTVAELQTARIPFYVRSFRGNTSDEKQYRTVLPDVFEMIREGSWAVMDNGGSFRRHLGFYRGQRAQISDKSENESYG